LAGRRISSGCGACSQSEAETIWLDLKTDLSLSSGSLSSLAPPPLPPDALLKPPWIRVRI